MTGMCPYCGQIVPIDHSLIRHHANTEAATCPGSWQNYRNPKSDRRPPWNGQPNPHATATGSDR